MAKEIKRHNNHTDRRVKRTKKALKEAFFKLLESKSINQITVTELTVLADVNRATFYFYYDDIHDMLRQIQNEAYQTFEQISEEATVSFSSVDGFAEYANKMLIVCKENESLCRFIINHDGDNHLYQQIRYLMLKKLPDTRAIFPEDNPARYSTNFVLSAVTGVLIDWMNDGMKIPTEDLAYFFANIYINGATITKDIFSNREP